MWTRKELKEKGKFAFRASYWKCVLVSFILSILGGGTTATVSRSGNSSEDISELFTNMDDEKKAILIGAFAASMLLIMLLSLLLRIFLFNPLQVGCYAFFKENVLSAGQNGDLNYLKSGFGNYGHTFLTLFLRDLFLILWTLLFVIPGIIKAYSYRMVPFILRDEPELTEMEVLTKSREMMKGNKWKTFVLDLSFIGWSLLGLITFGLVNLFWTSPYRNNTNAALYIELSRESGEGAPGMYV